jgi:H+/Cl- antiporter ClcA
MDAAIDKGRRKMSDFSQSIDPDLLTAGAAISGSLVSQLLNTKSISTRRMLGLGFAGALTGIWVSPVACDLLGIGQSNVHARAGMAFAVGLLGVALATLLIRFAETTSFPAFVARLFGVQLPPESSGQIQTNGKT